MSLAENKQVVLRFVEEICACRVASDLVNPDATFWSFRLGTVSRQQFFDMLARTAPIFSKPVKLTIRSTTAEGDRVTVEATGDGTLKDGRKYDNTYHFMFEVKNGKIQAMREYNDVRLATGLLGDGKG